ncbi:MAG: hypothetical protein A3H23_06025 [Planctomycetes bacterium RIFCSPLOWO2_12_FULL_40_19]|nr:MAG: hypothetical protein A3H23_06025 [Planctomycetes bacterium RIFCSPLOWO2_12_FULL_40_19]
MTNKHYIGAILIIISGFLLRMINIELPIFEVAMWRQCGTAYIARNFYEHGMNIFYPQMVGGGDIKGYIGESEFQIYTYTVAILYKLFGVHEYLGRLVSILAYCGGALFLYKLAIKYMDKTSGLIALLFYTFSPYLFFYTRSFQPDSCMLFFSIAMLYYFSEWIEKEGWWRYVLMTLFATLAFLTKLPTVCLGLPLLYLCLKKYKYNFIVQWELWLFATVGLVPLVLWCMHSHYLGETPDGLAWNAYRISGFSTYMNPHFYYRIFYAEIFESCLIYIGGVFLVLGIIFTIKKNEFRFIHYWLLAIIISFLLGGSGTAWHTYHTITIIAPASLLIGYAISNYTKILTTYKITGAKRVALVILFVLMVVSLPLISYHKITGRFKPERLEKDLPIYEVGKIADEILPKNALAIGCLMGGPEILYYSNRRGWTMGAGGCSIESIETLRREGAQYFITTEQDKIDKDVINYLKSKYKTIRSTNEYLIVQL